jgi:Holliday junction resolvase RusA-like endonuclease
MENRGRACDSAISQESISRYIESMLYEREKHALRILLLQIRKRRPALHISVDGDLGRKGRRDAGPIIDNIKRQVASSITDFQWKHAPRARMAVSMTFFPKSKQNPVLHNLVKFYMDELRALVFTDDRQVSYLTAESWLPMKKARDDEGDEPSKVYIEVERLADYKAKFDLYFTLLRNDGFRDYLRDRGDSFLGEDEFEIDSKFLADFPMLPDEVRGFIRRHDKEERQRKLLSFNQIHAEDRPGLPRWIRFLSPHLKRLREIEPFSVDLGNLPLKGETTIYRDRIRKSLQALKAKHTSLDRIVVPLELDVQVISSGSYVSKDLDNIMRDVAPIVGEELLASDTYLHGYRIYVAETSRSDYPSDLLRLKLLPMNGISDFENRTRRVFEIAEEWIEEQVNRYC